MITFFDEHPESRQKIQYYFACLGKKDHNHVESYLTNARNQMLPKDKIIYLLGILPICFFMVIIFFPNTWAIIGLMSSILFNVLFYLVKKEQLEQELVCMRYLVQMVACGKKISTIKNPMQKNLQPLASITKFGLAFRTKAGSEADLLLDYLSMIFMLPFISYNFVLKKLEKFDQEAKEAWHLLGEIEVAIAILNFRKCMPDTSQPIFSNQFCVLAEEVYHPLLETPVANPVNWTEHTLITGSNASGKSTYVKSVAISCLLSLTIHTALAKKFQLPFAHIMTSMAVTDNIFTGDSYFIAEIKSLKRILQVIEEGQPCLCFIDEILKGTNTVERIAASTGVADWLYQQQQALAFIATHDIELTEILVNRWQNVHFEEQVTQKQGITFDYQLKEGAAKSKNAIRLLDLLAYPTEIVHFAQQSAMFFEKNHYWKKIEKNSAIEKHE